ncbi:unnamed protein product [Kuraishia capsulata CBS 1993]|uniref:RING-type domain-containing protein n=1 Tax=Kuraishia capsulata CBS 1993 TaxID=1382522 RepID=W6MJK1_9ASCO|nr:uncharacterized protein KUCA_T00000593001 [Kuraishia capsulata CBS 1993]CDK24627.1 unnamed protein product [Kuraishia capsulata CBS 1993]
MAQTRLVDVSLAECDLLAITSLFSASPTKSKKRSRSEAAVSSVPVKGTRVSLADTRLRGNVRLCDPKIVSFLSENLEAFKTGEEVYGLTLPVVLAVDSEFLTVKSTRSSSQFFKVETSSLEPDEASRIQAQVRFLKRLKSSKKSPTLEHSLTCFCEISVESENLSVAVEIAWKINMIESVFEKIHSIDVKAIEAVLELETEKWPTEYQRGMAIDDIKRLRLETASSESFYELITQNTRASATENPEDNTPDQLKGELIKFQRDSVEWLLKHEGVKYDPISRKVLRIPFFDPRSDVYGTVDRCLDRLSFGFSRVQFHGNPEPFYYNRYSGNIISEQGAHAVLQLFECPPAQALLAEEMGLGKTVEIISLILLNPRPFSNEETTFDNFAGRQVYKSKTTLIICPDSIISQWSQEIANYAPHLSSTTYKGIYSFEKSSKGETKTPSEMAEELKGFDVVLVSYQVVARELHRALFNPSSRPRRKCARNLSSLLKDHEVATPEPTLAKVKSEALDSDDEEEESYHRIDYSSPLMLLQFWRIVLDEVQMVSNKISNAAKICRIIPRYHSWGVSGTPIRNNLSDLQSTLSFLRFTPFDDTTTVAAEAAWGKLVNAHPPIDFIRLWRQIALRHTKSMVADQIKLPEQSRVLLTVPFTAVERDNYDHLFDSFLSDVSLNANGEPIVEDWEPTTTVLTFMRQWLVRLRQTCCHAQIRQGNVRRRINENLGLGTIDTVLDDIRKESANEVLNRERFIAHTVLVQGQVREYQRRPEDAIKIWKGILPFIEEKVDVFREELANAMEVSRVNDVTEESQGSPVQNCRQRLRSWLELLHRAYFFIGSGHYQLYNPLPPISEVVNLEEEAVQALPNKDDIEDEDLTPEELAQRLIEREYYEKAELLRREMLEDNIKKVKTAVESLKTKLEEAVRKNDKNVTVAQIEEGKELPVVPILEIQDVSQYSVGLESRLVFEKYVLLIKSLNKQASYINSWIGKIAEVLQRPLNDDEVDKTGKEYQTSLDDQEITFSFLEILQLVLEDRELCVLTIDDSVAGKRKPTSNMVIQTFHTQEESALRKELNDIRNSILPDAAYDAKLSLRSLVARVKEQLDELSLNQDKRSEVEAKLLGTVYSRMKKDFDVQKKACTIARKIFSESLNETYNSRIEYYRSLQAFSDSVKAYKPAETLANPSEASVNSHFESLAKTVFDAQNRVRSTKARLHYLESLKKGLQANTFSEEDRFCTICQCSIVIGSLTACGHQYCKECLEEWMRNKKICPICKSPLRSSNIYNFTFPKAKLKGNMVVTSEEHTENSVSIQKQDLFSIYKPLEANVLEQIQEMELAKSYGSKVDLLVKQVMWLKKNEPNVQIIIFSQWADLLYVIGIALKQNQVEFLGSSETLSSGNGNYSHAGTVTNIAKFKNDSSITCFLLNAKAQAAGLTLVNASHVFLCEPLVNSPLELQAISRIHRIGQKNRTTVWMFVIENSVEESIVYLSTKKRLDLIKKNLGMSEDEDESEEAKNNTVDSIELTKTLNGLIEKRTDGGEVVSNQELWASFFSAKTSYI